MLLCGCTHDGFNICHEHGLPMNDHATAKIYGGPRCNYDLVYFEDRGQWFIRATNRTTQDQEYSAQGYDTKLEAMRAFEGTVTYVAEAPGKS